MNNVLYPQNRGLFMKVKGQVVSTCIIISLKIVKRNEIMQKEISTCDIVPFF